MNKKFDKYIYEQVRKSEEKKDLIKKLKNKYPNITEKNFAKMTIPELKKL